MENSFDNILSADLLDAAGDLYFYTIPAKTMPLTDFAAIHNFFEENGAEFDYGKASWNRVRLHYFLIGGVLPEYELHWVAGEIYVADKLGLLNVHPIVFFSKDSLGVDKFLLDFIELFPERRLSIPVQEGGGTITELLKDCFTHFSTLQGLYLKETVKILDKKSVTKKLKDKKKDRDFRE